MRCETIVILDMQRASTRGGGKGCEVLFSFLLGIDK